MSDLLHTLKILCLRCWSVEDSMKIDQLRLDTTLKMLKTPHFNAKMNALKEVWCCCVLQRLTECITCRW